MRLLLAATVAILIGSSTGKAQLTGGNNPSGYAPTLNTNRANQPLSPYLNLLRGGNNAVNYYYGVRGGGGGGGYQGMFNQGNLGPRQTYFPFPDTLSDFADDPRDAGRISPTGHPAGFANTLNYFAPGSGQSSQRQAQQPPRRR